MSSRGGIATLGAGVLLLLAVATARATDVLAELEACAARLDPELDVGFGRIAARCPRLATELEESPWLPWLPESWRDPGNDLSAGGLAELRELIERERERALLRDTPQPAALAPVLADLGRDGSERPSLWKRVRDWLRSILEPQRAAPRESWLERWLLRLDPSEAFLRAIGYLAIVAVIALAIVILINELRATGLLRARRSAAAARRVARASERSLPTWSDVEAAPLAERPGLVLRILLDLLTRARRLPPADRLTARELGALAELPGAQDRERFRELALVAERARYAGAAPPASAIEAVVTYARELASRLEPERVAQ
jgi:hypothetical protein